MNTLHMDISKCWKRKLREVFSHVWKCYRTDLTFVLSVVSCMFDKFLLLWIAFQKDFALLLELNSKNMKFFLVYTDVCLKQKLEIRKVGIPHSTEILKFKMVDSE